MKTGGLLMLTLEGFPGGLPVVSMDLRLGTVKSVMD